MPFGALALRALFHKVSSTSNFFFLATEFLFMATILQLKVAKRRFFEKVSLERCLIRKSGTIMLKYLSLDTTTYICDFHREQCWERWLRKADNGLNHQREEVLSLLRNVARSPTEDILHGNLKSSKASELWLSNPQL